MYKNRLKCLREKNKTTQNQLAILIGVQRPVYTQYENEYTTIPLLHLIKICDYFNVSLDYIFEFNFNTNYENNLKEVNKILSGKRLREFRKDIKITQEKLATFLNTTHSVISDYEKGRYLIATPFLYTICSKYHISADYLLGKIDNPKYLK